MPAEPHKGGVAPTSKPSSSSPQRKGPTALKGPLVGAEVLERSKASSPPEVVRNPVAKEDVTVVDTTGTSPSRRPSSPPEEPASDKASDKASEPATPESPQTDAATTEEKASPAIPEQPWVMLEEVRIDMTDPYYKQEQAWRNPTTGEVKYRPVGEGPPA